MGSSPTGRPSRRESPAASSRTLPQLQSAVDSASPSTSIPTRATSTQFRSAFRASSTTETRTGVRKSPSA